MYWIVVLLLRFSRSTKVLVLFINQFSSKEITWEEMEKIPRKDLTEGTRKEFMEETQEETGN